MRISDQSILLFLLIGVVIGLIYTINKGIIVIFGIKKVGNFFFDFTFAATVCVLTFIGALSTNYGNLRAIQILCELAGAFSFYYAIGNIVLWTICKIKTLFLLLKKEISMFSTPKI